MISRALLDWRESGRRSWAGGWSNPKLNEIPMAKSGQGLALANPSAKDGGSDMIEKVVLKTMTGCVKRPITRSPMRDRSHGVPHYGL
jgi:hypothetical protein